MGHDKFSGVRSLIKNELAAYANTGGAGAQPCDVKIHAILTSLRGLVPRVNNMLRA
jgi:hypothetical protein